MNDKMQKLTFIDIGNGVFPVIDNFYNDQDLIDIRDELIPLYEIAKLGVFENTSVTMDENKQPIQKSSSLFLDDLYKDKRHLSRILEINRKIFNENLSNELINKSVFYSYLRKCNSDHTLINFYRSNNYYDEHVDKCCLTAISFFELEKFSGGELYFPEYKITIEALHNRVVIFPGFMLHGAKKVHSGVRVSMAQFLRYNN